MLTTIIAILGGLIAAAPFIIAKQPNAKEYLDKLTPYQEWIGVLLTLYGVLGLLRGVLGFGALSLRWAISIGNSAAMFVVGFLLAYSLISKHLLSKNETARVKGQELRAKLIYYQVYAGLALIALGIASIVLRSNVI
jgi:hypothetical protein